MGWSLGHFMSLLAGQGCGGSSRHGAQEMPPAGPWGCRPLSPSDIASPEQQAFHDEPPTAGMCPSRVHVLPHGAAQVPLDTPLQTVVPLSLTLCEGEAQLSGGRSHRATPGCKGSWEGGLQSVGHKLGWGWGGAGPKGKEKSEMGGDVPCPFLRVPFLRESPPPSDSWLRTPVSHRASRWSSLSPCDCPTGLEDPSSH